MALTVSIGSGVASGDEPIDASDPTKIYTYAGGGVKYTDYTNGEYMTELRVTGNLGLSESDMILFELGYGWHSGDLVPGDSSDLTNARARWFHLFDMDYELEKGYRGWGTQVDLQLAGRLKGTDGQNVVSVGGLAGFGLGTSWDAFLALNLVGSWDKGWSNYNGTGFSVAPLFVYTPTNWWKGAYVQIWPNWTYFFTGQLKEEGSFNVDVTTGGPITESTLWAVTFQSNNNLDLTTFRRGRDTGLKNDWNVFFNVTKYF